MYIYIRKMMLQYFLQNYTKITLRECCVVSKYTVCMYVCIYLVLLELMYIRHVNKLLLSSSEYCNDTTFLLPLRREDTQLYCRTIIMSNRNGQREFQLRYNYNDEYQK